MSLPVGITKCTVTIGAGYTFLGEEAVISGSVIADRNVVWAATGAPIFKTESTVTPSISGGQASFAVPHVDQDGFLDNAGEVITGWYYVFNGRATFSDGRIEIITKRFQVFVGQTTIDLDLVPDGPVIPGVTTPTAYVTSVNGYTGAVNLVLTPYDTGIRRVPLDDDLGYLYIQRVGAYVDFFLNADFSGLASAALFPTGFRPQIQRLYTYINRNVSEAASLYVNPDGNIEQRDGSAPDLGAMEVSGGFFTTEVLPGSLPGEAFPF